MSTATSWRKSSYCDQGGGECVEVAGLARRGVGVRDSKDPSGPHLTVGRDAFQGLVEQVKLGDLDL